MKKVILMLLIVSLVVGCAPAEELPKTSGEVMKVAKYYWPGQFWIEIADEKGWFEEAGLNVELVDTNADYYKSLQDTVDGKIDVNNFPLFDVVNFNARGAELVMIVNADESSGSEALVAKKHITSIEELAGKTVAVSKGFYTEYILDIVLDEAGISNQITKVEITEDQNDKSAPEEFAKGKFDAVITWEPIVSQIVEKGGRKIWDTSKIDGISPNGITVKRSLIEQRPQDVQAYVNVWHKTTEFIKEHPKEAFRIIASNYNVTPGEVQAFTQDDKILDLKDNKIVFSYAAGFQSLHGTAKQINEFMKDHGITDKNLDTLNFIDARFIKNVAE